MRCYSGPALLFILRARQITRYGLSFDLCGLRDDMRGEKDEYHTAI